MFSSRSSFLANRRMIFDFSEKNDSDLYLDAFGMSDKSSSATNSLPNSPIHSNNNNPTLLNINNNTSSSNNSINGGNNNNNPSLGSSNSLVAVGSNGIMSAAGLVNNNNNNPCSANRNVVSMDDDSCFRLDTDTTVVTYGEKEPDPDNIKCLSARCPSRWMSRSCVRCLRNTAQCTRSMC
ncbi:probable serine/threonine-protein kinase fhkE [Drosophila serrata]|uniref:probable serine/threonine-protein kinase fhkE n=1 Tax=Drosophila serrata TaxID=7274 RepID=UPI000A1D07E7|nr:probable serine/threonine-protein kinase fhkE [Drosophila serrata]